MIKQGLINKIKNTVLVHNNGIEVSLALLCHSLARNYYNSKLFMSQILPT